MSNAPLALEYVQNMSFQITCHLENPQLPFLLLIIQYLQRYNCLRGKTKFHCMLIKVKERKILGMTDFDENTVTTNCDEG